MSYCINCGVELDASLTSCPLCNTPVINPSELEKAAMPSPYPKERGQVDTVRRKDISILATIVLVATSACCLLLNLFVFSDSQWSLFIIGACLLLYVLLIPVMIYVRFPIYIYLLLDGIATGVYLFLITFNTKDDRWFSELALPILALVVILVEIFALLLHAFPISFTTTALYFFVEIALLCPGLELLIRCYLDAPLRLRWSAVVITVCMVIVVMLITVLSRERLRNAARRRLHF